MTDVVVTGGAGAIGSNLVRALLQRGDRVTVVDDLSSGHAEHLPDGVRFVKGSITDDEVIRAAFAGGPEAVVHLAALFANQNSVEHPQADLLTNGLGTIKVFEAATEHGVGRVVNVSSSCVYGAREVMREQDPVDALDTPYAISKLLGEQYAGFWASHHGLPVVSVRLFNVYGPYELPGRYRNVVPNFIAAALRGEPLTITGTGDETRDFTYVSDTVAGIVGALDAEVALGDVFNIGSGTETQIRRLAELINDLAGNASGIRYAPRRDWDHVTRRVSDIGRARTILGYAPEVRLEDGLRLTIRWLRSVHGVS